MRILVACKESQAVTIEMRRLGHEAYSCDIIPCSGGHPEWHLQVDALELLKMKWDSVLPLPGILLSLRHLDPPFYPAAVSSPSDPSSSCKALNTPRFIKLAQHDRIRTGNSAATSAFSPMLNPCCIFVCECGNRTHALRHFTGIALAN